jgi:hypothetical protein
MSESAGELLSRVDRALEEYGDIRQTTQRVRDLRSLQGDIRSLSQSLRQVDAGLAALDQVGAPATRPQTRPLAAACRDAAGQVRQARSAPRNLPLKPMNDVAREAAEAAAEAWRAFIELSQPGLDSLGTLADTLARVGLDRTQATALKEAARSLQALARKMPDDEAVSQVGEAVYAARAARAALVGDSDAGRGDVGQFVEGVAQGGAPVTALTPAVRDWMRSHGIEPSFKIVPTRPARD